MKRSLALPMSLVALVWMGNAMADTPPSLWERARDPESIERDKIHRAVQERMHPVTDGGIEDRVTRNMLLESARAMLEEAHAATSPDVQLRFDLGNVYYRLDRFEQAIEVLKPALALQPTGEAADSAWLNLAFAAAKTDKSLEERDAYDAYLADTDSEGGVLNVLSNRAEAEMRLGELDEAVRGYRDVIDRVEHERFTLSRDYSILVLARWGLAVALDRNGDPTGAQREAFIAMKQDPQERIIGDKVDVFFVPTYERDWYLALGRTERAKHAPELRWAFVAWDSVVDTWTDYLKEAGPKDRWVRLAAAHLEAAKAEREDVRKRLALAHKLAPSETEHHRPSPWEWNPTQ